jgi:hypothetical protein
VGCIVAAGYKDREACQNKARDRSSIHEAHIPTAVQNECRTHAKPAADHVASPAAVAGAVPMGINGFSEASRTDLSAVGRHFASPNASVTFGTGIGLDLHRLVLREDLRADP